MWQALRDEVQREQERFDGEIRAEAESYAAAGGSIHCARGCRNCCSLAVHATFPEALRVASALRGKRGAALEAHVARLRGLLPELADLRSYLRLHRQRLGGCPFLADDGACAVYDARPFSCRSLLSTRPAEWCAVDLASLDGWDRELYLKSLDPAVVDYPTHYLSAPRERGEQLERAAALAMRERCGFALSGNLAVLVHLEREGRLSAAAAQGAETAASLLAESGLDHPLLVSLER